MDPGSPRKCFKCGKGGHLRKDCPDKKSTDMQKVKCFGCGKHGHYRKDCPTAASAAGSASAGSGKNSGTRKGSRKNQPSNVVFPDTTKTFVDTHCHLEYVYERYRHSGSLKDFQSEVGFPGCFEGCISTFCDPAAFSSFGLWQEILAEDNIWGTFGCHPHNAKYYNASLETKIVQCLEHPKAIALGEIGLDYSSHSPSPPEKQKLIFATMCRLAIRLGKPLVVHCRNAEEDTFEVLQNCVPHDWKIHMHCYSGSMKSAQKLLQAFTNVYMGFTGLVTFAKATNVHELAFDWPLEKLLLETDAPYHVPSQVSDNHQWSQPGLAVFVAQRIAEIKRVTLDEVLEAARNATKEMYGV